MKYFLTLLLFSGSIFFVKAQEINSFVDITTTGLVYSGEESPFWMHSNKRGRIDEVTNFSGLLTAGIYYQVTPNARLEAAVGGLFQDGYADSFQLDESYLNFENSWLQVVVGRKQKKEVFYGLSATNENVLWSLNARPIPGISVQTSRPIFFKGNKGLGFEAALEEYITDDSRFVENTRIHHKNFKLVYRHSPDFELSAGLQHFVQWAGTHPEYGELPSDFNSYFKMVTGRGANAEAGDEVGEQEVNGLGNHLGSYEVQLKTRVSNYKLHLIYNHLFEDGSGMDLANTPDGRYGVFLENLETTSWLDAVMYEFYYTRDQSSNSPTSDGRDNYFNNHLYRSGWTYQSRILGVPFIGLDDNRFRISNNLLIAHHLGIAGKVYNLPFKFLGSFRKNYGAKGGGNLRPHNILSGYVDIGVYNGILQANLQLGTDFNSIAAPNFGAGISLSKSFF